MVDTTDLKSVSVRSAGSSPAPGTKFCGPEALLVGCPELIIQSERPCRFEPDPAHHKYCNETQDY